MSKIRINDLARELEVKSKAILDVLTASRRHREEDAFQFARRARSGQSACSLQAAAGMRTLRPGRSAPRAMTADEIKTKIDLSHISKPGDVLKLSSATASAAAAGASAPPPPPRAPARAKPALLRLRAGHGSRPSRQACRASASRSSGSVNRLRRRLPSLRFRSPTLHRSRRSPRVPWSRHRLSAPAPPSGQPPAAPPTADSRRTRPPCQPPPPRGFGRPDAATAAASSDAGARRRA